MGVGVKTTQTAALQKPPPKNTNYPHLGVDDALGVGLRVAQLGEVGAVGLGDLGVGAVADEDRLAAPLDRHGLPLLDAGHVDLERRHRQHVGGRLFWFFVWFGG